MTPVFADQQPTRPGVSIAQLEQRADEARAAESRATTASAAAERDHRMYTAQLTAARQRRDEVIRAGASVAEVRTVDETIAQAQRRVDLAAAAVERAAGVLRDATETRTRADRAIRDAEARVRYLRGRPRELVQEHARCRNEFAELRPRYEGLARRMNELDQLIGTVCDELEQLTGKAVDRPRVGRVPHG